LVVTVGPVQSRVYRAALNSGGHILETLDI